MNGERFTMYIKMLMEDLLRTYGYSPGCIRIKVQAGDISLRKREITPCALIVNELMSNSLKYAFQKIGTGEIRVEFREVEDGGLMLSFCDNGIGLPESVNVSEPHTPGHAHSLLDGQAAWRDPPGLQAGGGRVHNLLQD